MSPAAVGISNFSSNNSTIGTRVFPDICTYLHILSVHRTTLQDNRHDGVSNYTGISCRCSHFFSTGLAFLAGPPANQSFLPAIEILGCVSSDHIAEAGKNCMLLAFLPGEHALPFSPIFLVETIGQSLPREQQSSLTFQQCQQVD